MTGAPDFAGIWTPLITPFDETGAPDRAALAALIDRLIAAGVHGLISGGSTGEYYAQNLEERTGLARFVLDQAAGRVPVMVGATAMRLEDSLHMARAARDMAADALLIGSPPYAVPTERENAANALAIAREAGLPVMLYNYPGRMGVDMGPEFLDRVGRSALIRAIKESSGDIDRLHLLARDYPHVGLCCGMDDQALEFFAWGARGWVCAGSNFLPEAHLALYRACARDGDFARGRRIMSALLPLMRLLEQGGKFIQCVKHGVELKGLRAGPPRPPLRALNKDDRRALAQVVRTLDVAVAEIEAEASPAPLREGAA